MTRKVVEFSFESHGIDHSQYWQGAGTAFSEWDECYTGIGESEYAAADDAIENLATCDWDLDGVKIDVPEWASKVEDVHDGCVEQFLSDYPQYNAIDPDTGEAFDVYDTSEWEQWHEECELHYFVTVYVKGEAN